MNFTVRETELEPRYRSKPKSFLEPPSLPITYKESDRTYVDLCLGTPPQCFNVILQTNTFALWVQDSTNKNNQVKNKFKKNESSTLSVELAQIGIGIYNQTVVGYTGIDTLSLGNVRVNKTKFVIVSKPEVFFYIDGMLGLGYNPSILEEDFSLLHQLYEQKIIPHLVFTLKYFSNQTGELSFGQIPHEIVQNYKQYGRCNALDKIVDNQAFKNKNWQCKLYSIIFGSKVSDTSITYPDSKLTFMSYRKKTYVPQEKFEAFEDKYFGRKLQDMTCRIINGENLKKKISCSDLSGLSDIILSFGDWGMKLEASQLFKEKSGEGLYEFLIYHKIGYEKFILGRRLLSLFEMVYDTHNHEIGFYSNSIDNKSNAVLLSNIEPLPPKLHEEIQDKKPKPSDKNTTKPKRDKTAKKDKKPEIEGDSTAGEINVIKGKKKFSSAFVIQVILIIFISLIVIGLLGVMLYTYKKYRKKTKFNSQNYYIKQVNANSLIL